MKYRLPPNKKLNVGVKGHFVNQELVHLRLQPGGMIVMSAAITNGTSLQTFNTPATLCEAPPPIPSTAVRGVPPILSTAMRGVPPILLPLATTAVRGVPPRHAYSIAFGKPPNNYWMRYERNILSNTNSYSYNVPTEKRFCFYRLLLIKCSSGF